jgi:hypothetical protein
VADVGHELALGPARGLRRLASQDELCRLLLLLGDEGAGHVDSAPGAGLQPFRGARGERDVGADQPEDQGDDPRGSPVDRQAFHPVAVEEEA